MPDSSKQVDVQIKGNNEVCPWASQWKVALVNSLVKIQPKSLNNGWVDAGIAYASYSLLQHLVLFQQVASARHPTKASTAKALVEPGDFPALWLDGFSLKPANHHSTPNLGHQALLIPVGSMGTDAKKCPRARLKAVETDPIFEAKNDLKFEASFGFKH